MANNDFDARSVEGQFVEQSTKKVIDSARRELIDRLLLERISLAGIARAAQVLETWLQQYGILRKKDSPAKMPHVNEKYALVRREVEVTPKKRGG